MKASAAESNARRPRPDLNADSVKLAHAGRFTPVLDSRNRRVPGLSQRNGRFYGQLWVERANGTQAAPAHIDFRCRLQPDG